MIWPWIGDLLKVRLVGGRDIDACLVLSESIYLDYTYGLSG